MSILCIAIASFAAQRVSGTCSWLAAEVLKSISVSRRATFVAL